MSLRQDHYKKMEKLLAPEQLGKYMVFEVRFHDEIQNFMSDMSRRRPQGPRGPQATPTPPAAPAP